MMSEMTAHDAAPVVAGSTDPVGARMLPAPGRPHLRLLGAFGLTDAYGAAVAIASPRARSLLAYLALHRDTPQPRRHVSFLLWPDSSEAGASNNLRQLLHQLRRAWPDVDVILTTGGGSLALAPGADLMIDLDEYEACVEAGLAADAREDPAAARLALDRASDLYRGPLLPAVYDEWILPERERLAARQARLLDRLIAILEQLGDYRAAIERGNERLLLDPLDERVVRVLMRLHALNQDRAGAIRVYQSCVAALDEALGVEPDAATRAARDRVLGLDEAAAGGPGAGRRVDHEPVAGRASAVRSAGGATIGSLVGRVTEWAQVVAAWERAAAGVAQLLVIAGEAGIGKSRLAAELADWVGRQGHAAASTRAYEAEGRLPFAPIADWLRSHAVAAALPRLDVGSLSEIARLVPELLVQRPDLPRPSGRIEDWQRQAFFHALAKAVHAADRPLLLVLDDLQWCDPGTLEWLHFLLRSDRQAAVLLVGTVRPEEVDRGHPLAELLAGLRDDGLRDDGQLTEIVLGPLDAAATSALAESTAGRRLRADQTLRIHVETEGNPLFVVETVRAELVDLGDWSSGGAGQTMDRPDAARGDPARPGVPRLDTNPTAGPAQWREAGARRLPPRVHAIIEARLGHLSEPARDLASLAATIGRAFTFDVIRASGVGDEDRLVAGMDELLRRQLVREQGDGAYDFSHDKIREVAYAATTEARRRLLHRRVADALETIHAEALDPVAAQIAGHCANAGLADRAAVNYRRAAEVAQRIGANQEAVVLLRRGLGLLERLPPTVDRDVRELELQTTLGSLLVATEGYGAAAVSAVYLRCRQLSHVLGRPPAMPVLRALALLALAQARIEECHVLGDHMLSLAERDDDPVQKVEAHYVIAMSLLLTGAVVPARVELETALGLYDRARSRAHVALYAQDPAVVCLIRLSLALWILGETEESARRRAESLALADELGHPFTRAYALAWDSVLQVHIGDPDRARAQAEAAMSFGRDQRMPFFLAMARIVRGWAIAEHGEIQTGVDEMTAGMAAFKATGALVFGSFHIGLLAEQSGRLGNVDDGLTLIADALSAADRTNERWAEAELLRRQGDLLATTPAGRVDAEVAYRHAIDIARYQGARALEARAATHLAALIGDRGDLTFS